MAEVTNPRVREFAAWEPYAREPKITQWIPIEDYERLRAALWLIKGTAKRYDGELSAEIVRICIRTLMGSVESPGDGLSMDETRFRAALFYAKPSADSPSRHRNAVRTAIESVWEHYERLKAEERTPDEPGAEHGR